ncbi:MAG: L-serine ammonia-lyase, iron-sulfur-dependent, subunit alpha [Proteobacteria bacterium]|nr:L-serine ammonia-lyase, iron-sulfur-dependent, subunit alpha [Pseudomonadota bacterium]
MKTYDKYLGVGEIEVARRLVPNASAIGAFIKQRCLQNSKYISIEEIVSVNPKFDIWETLKKVADKDSTPTGAATTVMKAPFRDLIPYFFDLVRNKVDQLHQESTNYEGGRSLAGPLRLFELIESLQDGFQEFSQESKDGADKLRDFRDHLRDAMMDDTKNICGVKVGKIKNYIGPMSNPVSPDLADEFRSVDQDRKEILALANYVIKEFHIACDELQLFPHLGSKSRNLFRILVIDDFYPLLFPWFDRMAALEPWSFAFLTGLPRVDNEFIEITSPRVLLDRAKDKIKESAGEGPTHLVILDIDFGWQGYGNVTREYLEALRQLLPGTPVIVASRWGFVNIINDFRDVGAVSYLCKRPDAYLMQQYGDLNQRQESKADSVVPKEWQSTIRKVLYKHWNVDEIKIPRIKHDLTLESTVELGRAILVDDAQYADLEFLAQWVSDPDFDDWCANFAGVQSVQEITLAAYIGEFLGPKDIQGALTIAKKLAEALCKASKGRIKDEPCNVAVLALQVLQKNRRFVFAPLAFDDNIYRVAIAMRTPAEAQEQDIYFYADKLKQRLCAVFMRSLNRKLRVECQYKERDRMSPSNNISAFVFEISTDGMTGREMGQALMGFSDDLHFMVVSDFSPLSIFDIVGPDMVGPSSSHTAGACRIGRLCRNWIQGIGKNGLAGSNLSLDIEMLGSFRTTGRGHGSDHAVLTGLLGKLPSSKDLPNGRLAFFPIKSPESQIREIEIGTWPEDNSIGVKEIRLLWGENRPSELHPNTIQFRLKGEQGQELGRLACRSWGGGNVQISGMEMNANGTKFSQQFSEDMLNENRKQFSGCKEIFIYSKEGSTELDITEMRDQNESPLFSVGATMESMKDSVIPELVTTLEGLALRNKGTIKQKAKKYEMSLSGRNKESIQKPKESETLSTDGVEMLLSLRGVLGVMLLSILEGLKLDPGQTAHSGYSKNLAQKLYDDAAIPLETQNESLGLAWRAYAFSLAVQEQNARMGRIIAAPTAGACGILPGALFALALNDKIIASLIELLEDPDEEYKLKLEPHSLMDKLEKLDGRMVEKLEGALLVSGMVGLIINNVVPTAGALLGCQAETGVGAAMAAAAVCDYLGDGNNQEQVMNAVALALKNSIGLICDPVGGKVETPCIKRSGMKAAEALIAGVAAYKGVKSDILPDEVLWVLREAGEAMPEKFRETSLGGLARTISGRSKCSSCNLQGTESECPK